MDIFHALLMNLHHPSGVIRLRTAQEMSKLLHTSNNEQFRKRYLCALKSCKLEMDVCSLLTIFCHQNLEPAVQMDEIRENISAPSILADMILMSLYDESISVTTWANSHSGQSPENFKKPSILENLRCKEPQYLDEIERLELKYGVPLVSQFYWEWNSLWTTFKGVPFSIRNISPYNTALNTVLGEVEPRQFEIYKSALLRTLSFAYSEYEIHLADLENVCLPIIPVNFDLFAINSQTPPNHWPKPIGHKASSYNKKWLKTQSKAFQSDPEFLPIAGKGIVYEGDDCCIELAFHVVALGKHSEHKIYRLFEDDRYRIPVSDWDDHFRFPNTLNASSIGKQSEGIKNFNIFPASISSVPPIYPRWQVHFLYDRFYLPNSLLIDDASTFKCTSKGISVIQNDEVIGDWQYWNHNWKPLRLDERYGSECSMLKIKRDALKKSKITPGLKLKIVFQLTKHTRDGSLSKFRREVNHHFVNL